MAIQKVGYTARCCSRWRVTGGPGVLTRAGAPGAARRNGIERVVVSTSFVENGETSYARYIEDIAKHDGEQVTIKGWLHNRRSSGKIHFLQVRDGSGFIQAVMSKAAVGEETFAQADHCPGDRASSSPAPCAPTRARRAATRST